MRLVKQRAKVLARVPEDGTVWELLRLETSPCTLACPTRINVRGYVSLVADGRYEDALALIRERNPFPGVCGRVCPRPCEAACRRGQFDEPIAICALKRYVFDVEMKRGIDPAVPAVASRNERVAVIGAGPAGLSAALELSRLGYPVTVFEAADSPGGMMNVIPAFRLPRRIIHREVDAILGGGIELVTGAVFGRDIRWATLRRKGFRALLLSTGAHRPVWSIGSPRTIDFVHALELLAHLPDFAAAGGVLPEQPEPLDWIDLRQRRVVVVGDGMLAVDAARTAVRLGCRSVCLVIGRSRSNVPVPRDDLAAAAREGVREVFLARAIRPLRSRGRLTGVSCIRLSENTSDATGRGEIRVRGGTEFTIDADLVVDAYARSVDARPLASELGLAVSYTGAVAVDPRTMAASPSGIFAAGDCVTGPRSVVEAIASGQKAARGIHEHLSGERSTSVFDAADEAHSPRTEFSLERLPDAPSPRRGMPVLDPGNRKRSFREVETGFTESAARVEAQRCLGCGLCAECRVCTDICDKRGMLLTVGDDCIVPLRADTGVWERSPAAVSMEREPERVEGRLAGTVCRVEAQRCVGCGRCEDACGYSAVRVEIRPGGRFTAGVNENVCKGCGTCVSVCPTGAMNQQHFARDVLRAGLAKIEPGKTRVVFFCRWASPGQLDLPGHVLAIGLMCTGRLGASLIVEAVERGSAGVLVCGCSPQRCHYGFGREVGSRALRQSREILRLLGFGERIVSEASCGPSDFNSVVRAWAERKR